MVCVLLNLLKSIICKVRSHEPQNASPSLPSYIIHLHGTLALYTPTSESTIYALHKLYLLLQSSQIRNIAVIISEFTNYSLQNSSPFSLHMPVVILHSIAALALDIIRGRTSKGLKPDWH